MSSFTLAAEYVTDTVGLILHLENRKSGTNAEMIFGSAEKGKTTIYIPAFVSAEILYLSEKNRITANFSDAYGLLTKFPNFKEFPLNADIIKTAEQITDIPELHDRLIAATARHWNLELITNDTKIQKSAFVKTIW